MIYFQFLFNFVSKDLRQQVHAFENISHIIVGHTQLLVEMVSLRFLGNRIRWRIVLLVELLKFDVLYSSLPLNSVAWFRCWVRLAQFARQTAAREKKTEVERPALLHPSANQVFCHPSSWWAILEGRATVLHEVCPLFRFRFAILFLNPNIISLNSSIQLRDSRITRKQRELFVRQVFFFRCIFAFAHLVSPRRRARRFQST